MEGKEKKKEQAIETKRAKSLCVLVCVRSQSITNRGSYSFRRVCAFFKRHSSTNSGPASSAWYPWQLPWKAVKVLMSMLSQTDRKDGQGAGSGPGL